MDQLPTEILNEIFILLHQRQKIECMQACSHWAKIINDSCLFHTLLIVNENRFQKVKAKLEQAPSYCLQVERLVICIQSVDGDFLSRFPLLFPNLRSYYRLPRISDRDEYIPDGLNQKWSNRIREFYDFVSPNLYHHLLESNKYDNLRILSIQNLKSSDGPWIENPLKNAPNLTSLILRYSSLKVEHLEQMHAYLPLLQSINFTYCIFDFSNLPKEIKPASRITHAYFDIDNPDQDSIFGLQQYIHKKYINLAEFSINFDDLSFLNIFEEDITEMSIRVEVIQKMLISLLYRFGHQLVKLGIKFEEFDPHRLENLEGAAYKLRHFKLTSNTLNNANMETLFKFGLFQHLRSLHLTKFADDSMICLKELANLKELTISDPKFNNLKLNDILDLCNRLEYIHFIRCRLSLELTSNAYALKKLNFSYTRLPKDIDTFISTSCSQLKYLRLVSCKYEAPSFCLEDLHLTRLEVVDISASYQDYYILVFTKDDDQRRWWKLEQAFDIYSESIIFEPYDDPVYHLSLPFAYDSLACQPYLTFNFGSVRHIYTCLI